MSRPELTEFARLGLVHHMLHPACMHDPDDHARTLAEFATRTDIETFDCCLPYGEERRQRLIPVIRECRKVDVTFAAHLFPLSRISFCETAQPAQAQTRMIVHDMVECAAAIGATGFIFASGGPPPDDATEAHHQAFAGFCRWLCAELAPHGITALLEPFDMTIDKCFLYGPTRECVGLIESLAPEVANLGIELDLAHVPLMGETFEQAIHTCAPLLKRVHLGNCVLRDTAHPRYGDTHPPIGFPGGEIDVPETARILQCLVNVGFLNRESRGNLVVEMTPWPRKSVAETVAGAWSRLEQAWAKVDPSSSALAAPAPGPARA